MSAWAVETLDQARWAVWAQHDWDEGVAHCMQRLSVMPDHGTVLDLGCGVGRLAIPVAQEHPDCTVLAVDSSPSMVEQLRGVLRSGPTNVEPVLAEVEVLDVEPLAGAWSVLCLQHLDAAHQQRVVNALAARLAPGAPLVLQHVVNCEQGPLSNPVPFRTMRRWVKAAGLTIGSYLMDPHYPTWRWMTGWRT